LFALKEARPTRESIYGGSFFRRTRKIEPNLDTELVLFGRIFFTSVTDVVLLSKPGMLYNLQAIYVFDISIN